MGLDCEGTAGVKGHCIVVRSEGVELGRDVDGNELGRNPKAETQPVD